MSDFSGVKTCNRCGAQNRDDAKFCQRCGGSFLGDPLPKKKKGCGWFVIGSGVVMALIGILLVCVSVIVKNLGQVGGAYEPGLILPTQIPPRAPAPTQIPTKTQAVQPSATANDSQALYEFASKMFVEVSGYSEAISGINTQMKAYFADPGLYYDKDWTYETAYQLSELKSHAENMSRIHGPARAQKIESLSDDLYAETLKFVENMILVIDEDDMTALKRATDNMIRIGDITEDLFDETERIRP